MLSKFSDDPHHIFRNLWHAGVVLEPHIHVVSPAWLDNNDMYGGSHVRVFLENAESAICTCHASIHLMLYLFITAVQFALFLKPVLVSTNQLMSLEHAWYILFDPGAF